LALAGFAAVVFPFTAIDIDTARAYSISGSSGSGPDLGSFTAPFENFFRSINNVGSVNISIPQQVGGSSGSLLVTGIQNAFGQFDNWLYGIAGFHISGFFTAILSIFSWLLGLVKGIVDWLLSLFQ